MQIAREVIICQRYYEKISYTHGYLNSYRYIDNTEVSIILATHGAIDGFISMAQYLRCCHFACMSANLHIYKESIQNIFGISFFSLSICTLIDHNVLWMYNEFLYNHAIWLHNVQLNNIRLINYLETRNYPLFFVKLLNIALCVNPEYSVTR